MDHVKTASPVMALDVSQMRSPNLRANEEEYELKELRWIRDLILLHFKQGVAEDLKKELEDWLEKFTNSETGFSKGSQPQFLKIFSFGILVDDEILAKFCQSLIKAGNMSEAAGLIGRIVLGYKNVFGYQHFIAILGQLGISSTTFSTHDFNEATIANEEMCNALVNYSAVSSIHKFALTIQLHIAALFMEQNKQAEALLILHDIHQMMITSLRSTYLKSIHVEMEIVYILRKSKNKIQAVELLKSIFKKLDITLGSTREETVEVQLEITGHLITSEKFVEAMAVIENVLPKKQLTLGFNHVSTLNVQEMKAFLYYKLGNLNESLSLNKFLYKTRMATLGPTHPDTLRARYRVASVWDEKGFAIEALRQYKVLYLLQQATLGADHYETCETLRQIIPCTEIVNKIGDDYRTTLDKQMSSLGPYHKDTLDTQCAIANLLSKTGHMFDALKSFEDLYKKKKRCFGGNHTETIHAKRVLDMVRRQWETEESGEQLVCSICSANIEFLLDKEATLPCECSHVFHKDCFLNFVRSKKTKTCPECRSRMHQANLDWYGLNE